MNKEEKNSNEATILQSAEENHEQQQENEEEEYNEPVKIDVERISDLTNIQEEGIQETLEKFEKTNKDHSFTNRLFCPMKEGSVEVQFLEFLPYFFGNWSSFHSS